MRMVRLKCEKENCQYFLVAKVATRLTIPINFKKTLRGWGIRGGPLTDSQQQKLPGAIGIVATKNCCELQRVNIMHDSGLMHKDLDINQAAPHTHENILANQSERPWMKRENLKKIVLNSCTTERIKDRHFAPEFFLLDVLTAPS